MTTRKKPSTDKEIVEAFKAKQKKEREYRAAYTAKKKQENFRLLSRQVPAELFDPLNAFLKEFVDRYAIARLGLQQFPEPRVSPLVRALTELAANVPMDKFVTSELRPNGTKDPAAVVIAPVPTALSKVAPAVTATVVVRDEDQMSIFDDLLKDQPAS